MVNNELTKFFAQKKQEILNIFFTAGHPNLEDTIPILQTLESNGVDIVEIGIPYSDPVADGPTIQDSSKQALDNGMTLQLLFDQLKQSNHKLPVVLMGYLNTVLQYGIEDFCTQCVACGISGVILPDLTVEVYEHDYKELFEQHNLSCIFLITPRTPVNRVALMDRMSTGFIYAVSSASTTGSKQIDYSALDYLNGLETVNPILAGFNITNKEDLSHVFQRANGGIIGSAFVKMLATTAGSLEDKISDFVQKLR